MAQCSCESNDASFRNQFEREFAMYRPDAENGNRYRLCGIGNAAIMVTWNSGETCTVVFCDDYARPYGSDGAKDHNDFVQHGWGYGNPVTCTSLNHLRVLVNHRGLYE